MTTTRTAAPATLHRQAAEAAYNADPTHTNLLALKVAGEAEMTEYLNGFDARHADDTYTNGVPEIAADAPLSPFAPWFDALLAQDAICTDRDAFERDAHRGYINYGLSMTDGYFAPLDFDAWVIDFRKDPIADLYRGNDARHALAPMVNSYARIIAQIIILPPTPSYDTLAPKPAPRTMKGDRNANRGSRHNR